MKTQIIVLCGPSGVGKSTILNRVLPEFPGIGFVVSGTTREPRPGEVDGVDYFFYSRETFEHSVKHGGFLEHAEVFGNYYGTPLHAVADAIGDEEKVVLLDIDPQGVRQVLKHPMGTVLYVAILPPSVEELERRLRGRGTDDEETLQRRMGSVGAYQALVDEGIYDHTLLNDDLEMAVAGMRALLGGVLAGNAA